MPAGTQQDGVSPIFTSETSAAMLVSCPYTSLDKQCAAEAPLGPDSCAANNISLQAALLACVHLSGLSDACYHDACVFDLCMGGAAVCRCLLRSARTPLPRREQINLVHRDLLPQTHLLARSLAHALPTLARETGAVGGVV